MANLLDVVREEFFSRLQTQTNWGKNQVQALYTQVQLEVLSSQIDNNAILEDKAKEEELLVALKRNAERINKEIRNEGYYNPRGTQSYDTNESPDAESPFKDDKDINKGSL